MDKKAMVLISNVLLLLALGNSALGLELKVDFAYPILRCPDHEHILECPVGSTDTDPCSVLRRNLTLKQGWTPFVPKHDTSWQYDLWRHDPRTMENVDGSGIDMRIQVGYEGDTSMKIAGMIPVYDAEIAQGHPIGDPIANSYVVSDRHWGNDPDTPRPYWGSIFLTLSGTVEPLKPGIYRISSYHNDSANLIYEGFDVMPSITVESADPQFPDGITPIEEAYNVPIQHELEDDKLEMTTITFLADGSAPVTIHYMSPEGYDHRMGGAAVLNAVVISVESVVRAFKPSPSDGAEGVHPAVGLSWASGQYTVSHDVYLGTDFDDVNNADTSSSVYKGPQSADATSYDPPGFLQMGTTYYWRIDEVGDANIWKGEVWGFTVDDGKARNPSPDDGTGDVPAEALLSWSPGPLAIAHDVYFGTGFDDVSDADTDTPDVYQGRQGIGNTTYDPQGLELATTYYWRIDEVGDSTPVKGDIWSFRTANLLVVDDFEPYDYVYNPITDTWIDGRTNETCSVIELGTAGSAPVHGGWRSMVYGYNNYNSGCSYSEAERPIADNAKDWTANGVKALSMWFHGDADNDVEQMYVALEDGVAGPNHVAVVEYDGDANDLTRQEWLEWNIDLEDFKQPKQTSVNDVDLTNIDSLYIGFGDREHPQQQGTGPSYVYFDDIRLYQSRCVGRYGPAADLDGDCAVGFKDLLIMADDWLKGDYTVQGVAADAGLVLHYAFEVLDGPIVLDSTDNHYHADVYTRAGTYQPPKDPCGYDGSCIKFEHEVWYEVFVVDVPNDVFTNHITNEITISVWLNWYNPTTMPAGNTILFSAMGGPGELYMPVINIETEWQVSTVKFWDSSASNPAFYDQLREEDWSGGWNHYAFVKDVDEGYLRVYHNAGLIAESDSKRPMVSPVDRVWMGVNPDFPAYDPTYWHDIYTGLVDDFKIYNTALSEAEIAYISSGGSDQYVPLESPANLYDLEQANSKKINFKDYAIFADSWLEKKWFPSGP